MTVHDLTGVPIPTDHPKFKEDEKITMVEELIEIKHDMREAKEALMALRNSMRTENQESIASLFQCPPWRISQAILSFISVDQLEIPPEL